MTRWFGHSWGAPACAPEDHVETPVGMPCAGHEHCHAERPAVIEDGDQGLLLPYLAGAGEPVQSVAYHLDCWLHEIGADRL